MERVRGIHQDWEPEPKKRTDTVSDSCTAHQTKEGRRWQVRSYSRRLINILSRRSCFHQSSTRSLRKQSGYFNVFSRTDWERLRTISVPYWFFKKRSFNKIRRTCGRRVWAEQRQESSVLPTRFVSGQKSRPEVQAVPPCEGWILMI